MAMSARGRRPRITGTRASARVEMRLTAAERAALEEVARENKTTIAALLRDAVNDYVEDYREQRLFVRQ